MRIGSRAGIWLLLALAPGCLVQDRPSRPTEGADRRQVELHGVEAVRYRSGVLTHGVVAARLLLSRSDGALATTRLRAHAYAPNGRRSGTLTAPTLVGNLHRERYRVSGGIRLVDAEGLIFDAPDGEIEPGPRLTSEGPVTVSGRNFQVDAVALDVDLVTGRVQSRGGRVRARLQPAPVR